VAFDLARRGLPVIIVNPTAPIGPRDVRPTPTGRVIVDYLNRSLPGYVETGLNWVHVRDVAIGHILAAELGRFGQRYILGNADGNWTLRQAFSVLEEITGVPAPKLRVPYPGRISRLVSMKRLQKSLGNRQGPRWPAFAWRSTKCFLILQRPSMNLAFPKLRPNRH